MKSGCIECTWNKNVNRYPQDADPALVREYQEKLRTLLDTRSGEWKVPEMGSHIKQLRRELFHEEEFDYSDIKRHFNALLLGYEEQMAQQIAAAPDPLGQAVRYAMTGNYIDFSVLDVREDTLWELLAGSDAIPIDDDTLRRFREETAAARTLAYVVDNCGEIVMDKLLVREMKKINPDLAVTFVVRGAPVANDATIEDAQQVDLGAEGQVIGNGTTMDGTILHALSEQARTCLTTADLVIAKGQANYESMVGCGLPVYYIFICKCALFMERFGVEKYGGILTRETGSETA